MKYVNFDNKGFLPQSWSEFKQEYRQRFWEELHKDILRQIKLMVEDNINEEFVMQIGADKYQRSDYRQDERNGYRWRNLETLYGYINRIKIPRARKMDIRFTIFDKWQCVQDKVLEAMTKAYLLGRSSATASEVVSGFGISKYSRSFYQRLVKRFEEGLKDWQQKKITKHWPYVFIDGMEIILKEIVETKKKQVIFAFGMDHQGNKELLGYLVASEETKEAVEALLKDLKERGLIAPDLFISDESKGIRQGIFAQFPHTSRQLCAFHKVKGINRNLTDLANRKDMMREAGDIYQLSSSKKEAGTRFITFCKRWRKKEPEAVRLFAENFEETLYYFNFPANIQKSIYTTNPIERFIEGVREWTERFKYFQGQANLELALFTYLCHKDGELMPKMDKQAFKTTGTTNEAYLEKPTFIVA